MSPISEDELRARLRGVEPSPAQSGFAEHVMHQGRFRRRRQRWLTGIAAAAAVAVIGGGALVISDQLGSETALPATPTPTSTQAEITPTVTSTRSPTPTRSPSPTSTPTTKTDAPSTPSSTPSRSVTLKPVSLLHEGNAEWVKSNFEGGLCVGEAAVLPQPQDYQELRVIWDSYIAGANRSEGLAVFPSADAAVSYMENLRRVASACNDESSGDVKTLVQPLSGPWGDGVTVAQAGRDPNIVETTYAGTRVSLFVRVGRAVAFADYANKSELVDTIDPEMIQQSRPAVEHVVPQLCRYTRAGC